MNTPVGTNTPAQTSGDAATWNVVTSFAFRFFCVYALVVWVPLTASVVAGRGTWRRPNDSLGRWAITQVLGLPEHSAAGAAGLFLPPLMGMATFAVAAAAVALLWELVDRRRRHYHLFVWVHTPVRFMLAALVLSYGWAKVFPAQYGFDVGLPTAAFDIADVGPRDLLWVFMAASRPYQVFAGVVEVTGGILLLMRRTAMLGALVTFAALANVFMLDVAYAVPAYFLAGQMLVMALFVLGPYAKSLLDATVLNRPTTPTRMRPLFHTKTADRALRFVGAVSAVWICYSAFTGAQQSAEKRVSDRNTPFYGVWEVVEIVADESAVSAADTGFWRIIFPLKTEAYTVSLHQPPGMYSLRIDSAAKSLNLKPFSSATGKPLLFSYELPAADQLVLRSQTGQVLNLRRVNVGFRPARFPPEWVW